ncbi:MAG: Card1-like endonuclease domain-containing protein [Promethearchaeota archaeon]
MIFDEKTLLIKLIFELQRIREEIARLRCVMEKGKVNLNTHAEELPRFQEMVVPQEKMSVKSFESHPGRTLESDDKQMLESVLDPENEEMLTQLEHEETITPIREFLIEKGIIIREYKISHSPDNVFDELALFLGERFTSLQKIHDTIRKNLSSGKSFVLNLYSATKEEISNTTSFCKRLHDVAFLKSYLYHKTNKIIHCTPQRYGKVINFFTGGWFERFVFIKIEELLISNDLEFQKAINLKITMRNGNDFELDLFFLINNKPLWVECKTSDYQNYIKKYSDVRSQLGVPKNRSFLIILGIDEKICSHLSNVYDINVANQNTFVPLISKALHAPSSIKTRYNRAIPPGSLLTFLNKLNLRPLPSLRKEAIKCLINSINKKPFSLIEIKSELASALNCSKSKTQDIINVLMKSKSFFDKNGDHVWSLKDEIFSVISESPEFINRKCVEYYAKVILQADPNFFEHDDNIIEFKNIVGDNPPSRERIKLLKKEIL